MHDGRDREKEEKRMEPKLTWMDGPCNALMGSGASNDRAVVKCIPGRLI